MSSQHDIAILRDLAKQYADVCRKPVYDERRDLWRAHNSLRPTRVPIYVRWGTAWREQPESRLQCQDPFYRQHEDTLRHMLWQDTIGDDYILEPWITQEAAKVVPPGSLWGPEIHHIPSPEPRGSWKFNPPIRTLEDIDKLVPPQHVIDEQQTATGFFGSLLGGKQAM